MMRGRGRRPEDDPHLTPLDQLFTYHIFGTPPDLSRWRKDVDAYRLRVAGLVESPLELSLHEIQTGFEPITRAMVLQCTTNVHWGRIEFTGARLWNVLERAGLSPDATKLALQGGDGFSTDLRLEDLRQSPDDFLLAYAMNGSPLPADHGYPLRATAEGRYGFKWCKWLTEIEAVAHDFKGHYEGRRGWSDAGLRGRPVI